MFTTINKSPLPTPPVQCDFWWEEEEAPGYTFDGDVFPYPPLFAGDTRYNIYTTVIKHLITFDAINQAPHIVTPPGISVIEYVWDFGDGTKAYGPVVTH